MSRIFKGTLLFLLCLLVKPGWAAGPTGLGLDSLLAPERLSMSLQLLLLLTFLSLAPALVVMVTSFTRLAVVFSFLRHALGTQTMPPNQILIALSLFLTVFIMAPVWHDIQDKAVNPYIQQKIAGPEAVKLGLKPLRAFMLKQTREKDLALFVSISKAPRPKTPADVRPS